MVRKIWRIMVKTCHLNPSGRQYWQVTLTKGIEPGYPCFISDDWDGLPSNVDAAFTWTNGRTYFFKVS